MRKKCRAKSVINERKYIETMKKHSPTSSYKVLISASSCCGYSQEAAITILHHHPKRQCFLGNLLVRNPSLLTRNRSSESRIEYSQSDSRVWCCIENFTNSTKHWKADVLCRHVFMVTLTNAFQGCQSTLRTKPQTRYDHFQPASEKGRAKAPI